MPSSGFTMGGLIVDESSQTALDYCTLADVENYTGVDFSDGIGPTESQIATMISNASRTLDAYAGRQIAGQLTATEYFDTNSSMKHIVCSLRPVSSVTNAWTVDDSGNETVLSQGRVRNTDDYWLADQEAGIIRFVGYFSDDIGQQALKVTYISGETSAPADAKMACILMVCRSAARAAMNDDNSLERIKVFWKDLLRSTESELNFWLDRVKQDNPVGVASYGLQGAYGG